MSGPRKRRQAWRGPRRWAGVLRDPDLARLDCQNCFILTHLTATGSDVIESTVIFGIDHVEAILVVLDIFVLKICDWKRENNVTVVQ